MVNDINEVRKTAKLYSELKTLTFILEKINKQESYYNGYVRIVRDDMLTFYDLELKREIPILLETIKIIAPSKKEEKK